jgi:hypothetical protein
MLYIKLSLSLVLACLVISYIRFKDIFQENYETNWRGRFQDAGIWYVYLMSIKQRSIYMFFPSVPD